MQRYQRRYLPRAEWRFKGDFELCGARFPSRGMAVLTDKYFGWRKSIFPLCYPFSCIRWFDSIDLTSIEAIEIGRGGNEICIRLNTGDDNSTLCYRTFGPDRWVKAWETFGIPVVGGKIVDTSTWWRLCNVYWWIIISIIGFAGALIVLAFCKIGWIRVTPIKAMMAYLAVFHVVFAVLALLKRYRCEASTRQEPTDSNQEESK